MARRTLRLGFLLAFIPACAGNGDPDDAMPGPAEASRALLAPFRTRTRIVCDRVEVDLSPEFYVELTTPAKNPLHRHSRVSGNPVEYRFVNGSGGITYPVNLGVGSLKLAVLEEAIVRVHEHSAPRLTLVAKGNVVLVGEDGSRRSCGTLTILAGELRATP